jgi:integrase
MKPNYPRAIRLDVDTAKATKPGDVIWDHTVTGLHLRHRAQKKAYYLFYRTKGGVQRNPKLGNYGAITLPQARRAAQEILAVVATGRDPGRECQAQKGSPTLGGLWAEWRKRKGLNKKTASADKRMWEMRLASFSKVKLVDLNYSMVADLHAGMAATPIQANRVVALLSAMLAFAVVPLRWIPLNPADGVDRFPENSRRRYLTAEESIRLNICLQIESEDHPAEVAFIYLLILTGARCGEIAAARWDQVQDGKIVLTEHKTDKRGSRREIHLPIAAQMILAELPRDTATITGVKAPELFWRKLRVDAGCPDLRMHDLRHSFASAALSAGFSLAQIGELLGHSSPNTTKRYAHLADGLASKVADQVGAGIVAGFSSGPLSTRVPPRLSGDALAPNSNDCR